ncbi:hypothetical protein VB712_04820 [Spirulina sp. CCNP1310]|uniref:hypothetical protein n=1 Tax=Spirulina sp. CCNP1310 TaxID=3110249 RepID=UPI002B1F0724|nr:hypothetical protein [Spirulina sp. CCNP1310]MEA5418539.1 hypothetical protein [Spirulina sp. CCNP1310]
MKYPWLPRPRYIIKSLLLIPEAALAATIGEFFGSLMIIPLVFGGGPGISELLAVFGSLFSVVLVPIYVFAQGDRLIWHRPKRWGNLGWLPHKRSWGEGIFAYFTLMIAVGIPIVSMEIVGDTSQEFTGGQAIIFAIAFFAIASYLYHLGGFVWRWKQSRRKTPNRRGV